MEKHNTNHGQKRKKILVFGVFDRLHPGHISFLRQASELGDELVVAVARDSIVQKLKKKKPAESENMRMDRVALIAGVTRAVLGDQELGSWDTITAHEPDVICFGYDQQWIKRDIEERIAAGSLPRIRVHVADAHEPERLHTSLLIDTCC